MATPIVWAIGARPVSFSLPATESPGIAENKMSYKIEFGGRELLGSVEILWKELNRIHEAKSPYFNEDFSSFSFETRKRELIEKSERGSLRVVIASDQQGRIIGYCISSIEGREGEIDSIFVTEANRRKGIGAKLVEDSMHWLHRNSAEKITVAVVYGNEEVFDFYRKFGLFPRVTILTSRQRINHSVD